MEPNDVVISTEWLDNNLEEPNILPLDCRVRRVIHPSGPSTFENCREEWIQARIPNSGYLHMVDDLSDADNTLPFMLPAPEQVASVLSKFGVTKKTKIIVYGEAGEMSVHRSWWVLKASGHPAVDVLDGGFNLWKSEGRRIASGSATFSESNYEPASLSEIIATRNEVIDALTNPDTVLVNALPDDIFRGEGGQVFGRRGHIPTSINIPSETLIDAASGKLLPIHELKDVFNSRLPQDTKMIIPYCGGGIAASTLAFAFTAAGYPNVQLYDGSLFDWTQDPDAPMNLGDSK